MYQGIGLAEHDQRLLWAAMARANLCPISEDSVCSASLNDRPVYSRKTWSMFGLCRVTEVTVPPASMITFRTAGMAVSPLSTFTRYSDPSLLTSMIPGTCCSIGVKSLPSSIDIWMTSPPKERFSVAGVSRAMIRPWSMMPMRSHRLSASSR